MEGTDFGCLSATLSGLEIRKGHGVYACTCVCVCARARVVVFPFWAPAVRIRIQFHFPRGNKCSNFSELSEQEIWKASGLMLFVVHLGVARAISSRVQELHQVSLGLGGMGSQGGDNFQ